MNFRKIYHLFFIMMTGIVLSSCSSKVEDKNGSEGASNFNYSSIEVVDVQTIASNSKWPDLKDKALINLKSCLIDTVYLENIAGEEFSINSNLASTTRTTNASGCMYWSEELDFHYLNQESYYKIEGKVRGLDAHSGSRSYSLAINPWSKKLIDLRDNDIFNVNSIQKVLKKNEGEKFVVSEDFSISIIDKKFLQNETVLEMEISTTPQLIRKDLYGGIVKESLSAGGFETKYLLLARDVNTDKRSVLAQSSTKIVEISEDGRLKTRVSFNLNEGAALNSDSIIELGVRMLPLNSYLFLSGVEGVLPMKVLDGNFTTKLLPISSALLSELESSRDNNKNIAEVSDDNFGFIIDSINITKGAENGSNLSGHSNRSVNAIFDVKMVDSLIREPILNQSFRVDLINNKTSESVYSQIVRSKTGSGNLDFRIILPFQSYEKRIWKEYTLKISGTKNPYQSISKSRLVYINPWVKEEFAIDSKVGVPPKSDSDNTPQIHLSDFKFKFVGNDESSFKLNKSLDLSMKRTMRIEANPQTKLDHSFSGPNSGYEKLLNGEYKLRFLILVPKDTFSVDYTKNIDLNNFYTLTGDEKTVTVENGYMNAKVDLPLLFTDFMFLSLKNIALIELSPMQKDVALKPGYFIGSIVGTDTSGQVVASEGSKLSTGNLNVAKTLISKLKPVSYKLEDDAYIGDNMKLFLNELQKSEQTRVLTFDYSTYSERSKTTQLSIFESTKNFFDTYNSLWRDEKQLDSDISKGELSKYGQELVCHFMYDKNAKTQDGWFDYVYKKGIFGQDELIYRTPLKSKGIWYTDCINNFSKHVEYAQKQHVEKITEQPWSVTSESRKLVRANAAFVSTGQQFSKQKGVRETDYFAQGMEAHVGLKLPSNFISAGIEAHTSYGHRVDLYTTDNMSQIVSNQERIINDDSAVFPYTRFDIQFEAQIRTCLIITPKHVEFRPKIKKGFKTSPIAKLLDKDEKQRVLSVSSHKRLYLCSNKSEVKKQNDSWYFIRLLSGSDLADTHLAKNTIVNFIRGEENFKTFRTEHIDTDRQLIINRAHDKEVGERTGEYLKQRGRGIKLHNRVGIGFPGLL